ncbi:mCG14587, isoform CRA_c, partial [Mus musculus]
VTQTHVPLPPAHRYGQASASAQETQKSPAWHQAPRKDVKTNHVSPSFLATICLMAVKPSRILNGWRLPAGLLSSSFAYASCQAPKNS